MTESAVIMGIDPGVKTGIALYNGGKLCELRTIAPADYERVLLDIQPVLVVLEDSRLTSKVFTGPTKNERSRLKIARNIGMVDGFCYLLFDQCERNDIEAIGVAPIDKGRKLKAAPFGNYTRYTGTSNQHERDAGMVAWPFRHKRAKAPVDCNN